MNEQQFNQILTQIRYTLDASNQDAEARIMLAKLQVANALRLLDDGRRQRLETMMHVRDTVEHKREADGDVLFA